VGTIPPLDELSSSVAKIRRAFTHFCPQPNHQGKKNSPSFPANLEKGIFQCFGCGAKGNVLEFAAMMESFQATAN
jgi:DNA primase